MNLADCYRLLGLRSGSSFDEIKASYRRLARQYHPDVNPGDHLAKEKFIAINEAYRLLVAAKQQVGTNSNNRSKVSSSRKDTVTVSPASAATPPRPVTVSRKTPPIQVNPNLSPLEQQLKAQTYEQLQQLLKQQRFPRAIALVEGLAKRIPQDPEAIQWQAIVYQRWGRHLIKERQFDKARLYLKKALRTDPHNRSLWAEVEKDFRYLEQVF